MCVTRVVSCCGESNCVLGRRSIDQEESVTPANADTLVMNLLCNFCLWVFFEVLCECLVIQVPLISTQ